MRCNLRSIGIKPVGFTKIHNGSCNGIREAIEECLDLIQYQIPKTAKTVIIKPNLCYYHDHSTGQTTDPAFIGALIETIRTKNSGTPNISIVESDASAMKCKHAFHFLGYEALAKKYNVRLVNLSEEKSAKEQVTICGHKLTFSVPNIIREADLRINVPKIKYMNFVTISCAMKNLYGCNPFPLKYKFHTWLSESIVAISKLMNFDLHILDGIVMLGAFPRRMNLVVASEDPVALDSAASKIAGQNPNKIKYLYLAQKEGLGRIEHVSIGMNPKTFQRSFPIIEKTLNPISLAANIYTRTRSRIIRNKKM